MLLWMVLSVWFFNRYVCLSRLLFFIHKVVNRDCLPSLPFLLLLWRLLCATWQGQFNIDGRMCSYACFLEILSKVEQTPIQRGIYIQTEWILWETALNHRLHRPAVRECQRAVISLLKSLVNFAAFFSCITPPIPESDEELGLTENKQNSRFYPL